MNIDKLNELKKLFEVQKKEKEEIYMEHIKQLQENQIKFEDCKEGYTYEIDARNFTYAIFHDEKFYGIRYKWCDTFIDTEIHWDKDDHYGTVRPQVEIEKTPDYVMKAVRCEYDTIEINFKIIRDYLIRFNK